MIFDIQPVADLIAVAIDRQRLAGECVDDHQRDQFFREVERPIVVGAVGSEYRHAVGMEIRTYQVVAGRLAGRVGAVRRVRGGLREGWVVWPKCAVDFVSGNVEEAECLFLCTLQAIPMRPGGFQQTECAHHVGLDKCFGAGD
ncbi:hypothetical protein D3C80_1406590 [compost metagenome]